jgi:hypothetical protein
MESVTHFGLKVLTKLISTKQTAYTTKQELKKNPKTKTAIQEDSHRKKTAKQRPFTKSL